MNIEQIQNLEKEYLNIVEFKQPILQKTIKAIKIYRSNYIDIYYVFLAGWFIFAIKDKEFLNENEIQEYYRKDY